MNEIEEAVKKAIINLAGAKELWLIEELKPMFDFNEKTGIATIKEHYRLRLQTIEDYKKKVKEIIDKHMMRGSLVLLEELKGELGLEEKNGS